MHASYSLTEGQAVNLFSLQFYMREMPDDKQVQKKSTSQETKK